MRRFAGVAAVVAATSLVLFAAQRASATYPGKNGLIAISLEQETGGPQINTIQPNGRGLQQITSVTGAAFDPDWSPDGTKIVFDVGAANAENGCHIKTMNADGSNVVDVTPKRVIGPDACAYNPSFTPDGRRIVFLAQRCTACGLWISVMNLHGGNRRRIVHSPHHYGMHAPRVSPDGKTILFLAERDAVVNGVEGNRKTLYTVRMNGTQMTQLLPFRFDVCACGGDWAPDGKRIVSSDQIGPNARSGFLVQPLHDPPGRDGAAVSKPTIARRARTRSSVPGRTRRMADGSSSTRQWPRGAVCDVEDPPERQSPDTRPHVHVQLLRTGLGATSKLADKRL